MTTWAPATEAETAIWPTAMLIHHLALAFPCPYCDARPGLPCTTTGGSGREPHTNRERMLSELWERGYMAGRQAKS